MIILILMPKTHPKKVGNERSKNVADGNRFKNHLFWEIAIENHACKGADLRPSTTLASWTNIFDAVKNACLVLLSSLEKAP